MKQTMTIILIAGVSSYLLAGPGKTPIIINRHPRPAAFPVPDALTAADMALVTPIQPGDPVNAFQVLKFHVPEGTSIQVSANGWILALDTGTCSADDGCYELLSENTTGGQTTYVIQTHPQGYKRWADQVEIEITDVSLNTSLSGTQRASNALVVQFTEPLSSAGGAIPQTLTAIRGTDFLKFRTIGVLTDQDADPDAYADAYYKAIDPNGNKTTLPDWKKANGFAVDDSQDTAKADYFNAGDLALGRSMHMKVNGENVAYYVTNYLTVDDAVRRTNPIATVAMDYSFDEPQKTISVHGRQISIGAALGIIEAGKAPKINNPRFVKFYVFDGKTNKRVNFADLDLNGKKYVPGLCIICHGQIPYQNTNLSGDVKARFLPFDLNSFQYGVNVSGASRRDDEAAFKQLNYGVYKYNATRAEIQLLEKWYGGPNLPNSVQNNDAVPDGWSNHEDLYRNVIARSCRTCHVAQVPGYDFSDFASFNQYSKDASRYICTEKNMPNSKVTYEKFWLETYRVNPNPAPQHATDILFESGLDGFSAGQACP